MPGARGVAASGRVPGIPPPGGLHAEPPSDSAVAVGPRRGVASGGGAQLGLSTPKLMVQGRFW